MFCSVITLNPLYVLSNVRYRDRYRVHVLFTQVSVLISSTIKEIQNKQHHQNNTIKTTPSKQTPSKQHHQNNTIKTTPSKQHHQNNTIKTTPAKQHHQSKHHQNNNISVYYK